MAVLAPILPLSQPTPKLRIVPWKVSRFKEFLRQYLSALEAALKYRMAAETVRRRIHEGKLAAVRTRQGPAVGRPARAGGLCEAASEAGDEGPGEGLKTPTDDDAETVAQEGVLVIEVNSSVPSRFRTAV